MAGVDRRGAASRDGQIRDEVDGIIEEWARERPDLDVDTVGVVSRIYRLDARFRQATDRVFRRYGLSRGGFEALAALRRSGGGDGLTQVELGRRLGLSPGTVSVRVDRLIADGFATRRADCEDRRAVIVRLTERGRSLIDELAPVHIANQRSLLAPLSAQEQRRLATLLRKLVVGLAGAGSPVVGDPQAAEGAERREPGTPRRSS